MKELRVQKYLREGNTLEQLETEFGVIHKFDKNLEICVLNYSQIDSKKTDQIACESRALILEVGTWNIIAKTFTRFFNYGEQAGDGIQSWDLAEGFEFDKCDYYEKRDGSLVSIFNYKGEWRIATRGTIDNDACPKGSDQTFTELIKEGLLTRLSWHGNTDGSEIDRERMFEGFDKEYSYILEITSPKNRIVTRYENTELALVGARNQITGCEVGGRSLSILADATNISRPIKFDYTNVNDLIKHLDEEYDPTFEGVVAVNRVANEYGDFQRVKIKKDSYIFLHHLLDKIGTDHAILGIIIKNEQDEVINQFPNYTDLIRNIEVKYNSYLKRIKLAEMKAWELIDAGASKKDFAISIKDEPNKPYFFALYDKKVTTYPEFVNLQIEQKGIKNISKNLIKEISYVN